jgi:predicted ester cyclase
MTEDRKTRIRKGLDEIYNQGHLEKIDQRYDSGITCHQSPFPELNGKDELKGYVRDLRNAYSDFKASIGEGDPMVVRGYIQGTHTGQSMNLQLTPTRKQMKVPFCTVTHWKNDKIVEEFTYVDLLLLTRQLGAIPNGSMESG